MTDEKGKGADQDLLSLLHERSGQPLTDRRETVQWMKTLMGNKASEEKDLLETDSTENLTRPALSNVYGDGLLLLSDIPASCKQDGVVLGIDEAGRGSVLGPMLYGCAFWNRSQADKIPKGFNDSKQLTEGARNQLMNKILHETPQIGFCARVLQASEISRNMLRPEPYNLNQMSHDAAMSMIRVVLAAGVKVETCYIDTVGIAEHYQRRLEREFPGLDFVVESKADANYAPCCAASIVAKVTRDHMIQNWKFSEPLLNANTSFGSGYPSDPVCKKWMEEHLQCKIFGYPDVVRYSWRPAKNSLETSKAATVTFAADVDEDENDFSLKRQQEQMRAFVGGKPSKKKPRYGFFARNGLEVVSDLNNL